MYFGSVALVWPLVQRRGPVVLGEELSSHHKSASHSIAQSLDSSDAFEYKMPGFQELFVP